MKKTNCTISSLILITISFALNIPAQSQDFVYPLEAGARWSWSSSWTGAGIQIVMRDTLMPNGKTYTLMNNLFSPSWFWQISTRFERKYQNRVYRYNPDADTEYVWFDFSAQVHDTINHNPNIILQQIQSETLFGVSRRTYWFLYDPIPEVIDDEIEFRVTDSIGMSLAILSNDVLQLKGAQIGSQTYGTITNVLELSTSLPQRFSLEPVYPNPFNNSAKIRFKVFETNLISIHVFDLLGRQVRILLNRYVTPGTYEIEFNADALPSGVYLCSMRAKEFSQLQKMILLR